MSKKQIRITEAGEIKRRMHEFSGRQISLVLTDNTVIFGALTKIETDCVIITNMRQREMPIRLVRIAEIYTDIDA
ncbi:MAG TPA: hypothetical protein VIH22_15640 [Cyclobacteriaceae bacterium]